MTIVDFSMRVQAAVQHLRHRYTWRLLTEDELCQEVQRVVVTQPAMSTVETLITRCYAKVLYTACCQTVDGARRELAYTELHRYLHHNAQKHDLAEAEDLAQAALQLVFEQLDRCRQPEAFFTFALYKLLHVTKQSRRRQAKTSEQSGDEADLAQVTDPQARSLVDRLCHKEGLELLLKALARLRDERQRTTILLKYFEGLADEEIAQRLAITANHVRVLRTRALTILRSDPALRAYFADDIGE